MVLGWLWGGFGVVLGWVAGFTLQLGSWLSGWLICVAAVAVVWSFFLGVCVCVLVWFCSG